MTRSFSVVVRHRASGKLESVSVNAENQGKARDKCLKQKSNCEVMFIKDNGLYDPKSAKHPKKGKR